MGLPLLTLMKLIMPEVLEDDGDIVNILGGKVSSPCFANDIKCKGSQWLCTTKSLLFRIPIS